MKLILFIAFLIIPVVLVGQAIDSSRYDMDSIQYLLSSTPVITSKIDSIDQRSLKKVDSIQSAFKFKTDSLQQFYKEPLNKIDLAILSVQHKVDSLSSLKLPAEKLTTKMDSLTQLKSKKMAELNQKVEQLKSKATAGLKEVTLPPQMQEPLNELTKSINSYMPTLPNGKLQEFNPGKLPGMKELDIPKVKIPDVKNSTLQGNGLGELGKNIPKSDELNKLTGELGKVKEITGDVSGLAKDAQSIATGKMEEVKHIDKAIEKQVLKIDEVQELQKQAGAINPLADSGLTGTDPEALKKQAAEMAKKEAMETVKAEAIDHFAGKQELLQKSIDKMTKLKGKYSEVKSMAELPKKLPNPLRDMPFIERIIPGVTFQIQKNDYFLLDINVYAMYRIIPRFSAGIGFVERLPFEKLTFQQNRERAYGPRAAFQFNWTKGINFRFLPEVLNTYVPPQLSKNPSDNSNREWVWSAFVGIKKDFTVYKNIKGNTEALYNLYDPQSKSPYQDRFSIRFGFEFPCLSGRKAIKKKVKIQKESGASGSSN
jgi:hypothetical protein